MDLDEFVKQSLLDVVKGLRAANDEVAGGPVRERGKFTFQLDSRPQSVGPGTIHFDIAVTTREAASSGGKLGARIAVFEASMGGTDGKSTERASPLKFSVLLGSVVS